MKGARQRGVDHVVGLHVAGLQPGPVPPVVARASSQMSRSRRRNAWVAARSACATRESPESALARRRRRRKFLTHHTRIPAGRQGEQRKLGIRMRSGVRKFLNMRILVRNFLIFVRKK
jgi:hypothetical protein